MNEQQTQASSLNGLNPSHIIIDEEVAMPADQQEEHFITTPEIERIRCLLRMNTIEDVCKLSLEAFNSLYSIFGYVNAEQEFRDVIASIVRHYRGETYLNVTRRVNDHWDRGFTFQQMEYYERKLMETGEVEIAISYARNIGVSPNVEASQGDEIMPSDSRYNDLVKAIILTYRHTYRGNNYAVMGKLSDHKRNVFSVRQVLRYETHYSQEGNTSGAMDFARNSSAPIPSDWLLTEWKAPEFKKVTWKETFLRATFPEGVPALLARKVAKLTDKKDILKTVFMYQNPKTPRKKKVLKPNPAMLIRLREHNLADHNGTYIARLEQFYLGSDARRENREDLRQWVIRFGKVAKPVTSDEGILTHPAFKVDKCGNDTTLAHGDRGFRIVVTTRNDVWFTYLGQQMNFGKLSFAISLRDQTIGYVSRPDNFSGHPNPYISNSGKVCMGSNQASIMSNLKAGKLSEALSELFHTMTNFNPDSTPYEGLDHFFSKAQVGTLTRNNGQLAEIEVIA